MAAREYGNITNGNQRSNANHGTNDLNLPIDSRVFEAAIQGVDLHAIRFAQHLPETQSVLHKTQKQSVLLKISLKHKTRFLERKWRELYNRKNFFLGTIAFIFNI